MATPKAGAEAFALVSYFEKKYKERYGTTPVLNRYSGRWFFESTQMPSDSVKALIDYYFTTVSTVSHSFEWFMYNYDKLLTAKIEHDKDAELRRRRAEQSRRRTQEWKELIEERNKST